MRFYSNFHHELLYQIVLKTVWYHKKYGFQSGHNKRPYKIISLSQLQNESTPNEHRILYTMFWYILIYHIWNIPFYLNCKCWRNNIYFLHFLSLMYIITFKIRSKYTIWIDYITLLTLHSKKELCIWNYCYGVANVKLCCMFYLTST